MLPGMKDEWHAGRERQKTTKQNQWLSWRRGKEKEIKKMRRKIESLAMVCMLAFASFFF